MLRSVLSGFALWAALATSTVTAAPTVQATPSPNAAQTDPTQLLQQGVQLFEAGRDSEAQVIFEQLRTRYPTQPAPYINLAAIQVRAGNYEAARELLNQALARAPKRPGILEGLAKVHLGLAWQLLKQRDEAGPPDVVRQQQLKVLETLLDPAQSPAPKATISAEPPTATAPPSAQLAATQTGTFDAHSFLQDWCAAWAAKDWDRFSMFYAADYRPDGRQSPKSWAAKKRRIFRSSKTLHLECTPLKSFPMDEGHAFLMMDQAYQAGRYQSQDQKLLELRRTNAQWQIVREIRLAPERRTAE